jgi:hypothetical protein
MIGYLLSILTASNRVAQTETNFEKIEREVFTLKPTLIAGVANTVVGPPVSGERLLDEVWVDSLRAKWHCTVAGTPGTWRQIAPAIVTTAARPVTPPDGYLIEDTDEHFKRYYWNDGGAAWAAV